MRQRRYPTCGQHSECRENRAKNHQRCERLAYPKALKNSGASREPPPRALSKRPRMFWDEWTEQNSPYSQVRVPPRRGSVESTDCKSYQAEGIKPSESFDRLQPTCPSDCAHLLPLMPQLTGSRRKVICSGVFIGADLLEAVRQTLSANPYDQ